MIQVNPKYLHSTQREDNIWRDKNVSKKSCPSQNKIVDTKQCKTKQNLEKKNLKQSTQWNKKKKTITQNNKQTKINKCQTIGQTNNKYQITSLIAKNIFTNKQQNMYTNKILIKLEEKIARSSKSNLQWNLKSHNEIHLSWKIRHLPSAAASMSCLVRGMHLAAVRYRCPKATDFWFTETHPKPGHFDKGAE